MILKALPFFGLIVILLFESTASQDNVQASNQCVSPKVRDYLLGIYQEEILPKLKVDIDAQMSTCQDDFAQKISTKAQEWTARFEAMEDKQTQITNECHDNKEKIAALESTVALLRRDLACQSCSKEGTEECDPNGECSCKPGFVGPKCDIVANGSYAGMIVDLNQKYHSMHGGMVLTTKAI